ncbi:nitrogen regulation protein NR(I) [uncultured Aquimonas sp.]|uniref:nitrogen regulation protein NR(I) n=1 Tax=uncultured Aquimonas sp. TaxID=385483 RepID=UPI00086BCBD1|nr:nitrogen regulation protein NR(I) [uncultured Aquimonas sp.]ODU42104.1 MAG: nitrogen regulation protein NR(I) [Xanthomonadaceae bacterium SCN 69-123]
MATKPSHLWVIDDDRSVRFVLAEGLRDAGFEVREFDGPGPALAALAKSTPAAVFTDVRMPEMDGLKLLNVLKADHPELPIIVMSAYTDVASTAGAFRGGAHDFLSKPFDLDTAVAMARRALQQDEAEPAPPTPPARDTPDLVGEAPAMRELFRAIGKLAQAPLSVLIIGETGTGKELVARALHRHSPRAQAPFVALNTAAIPSELLESELFGHEPGAFTGAARRHHGRFEQADGGTLFLDEIGDMPAALQTRLLRVLAEGEFFRIGGRELIRVDVRVIAATHQPLDALVEQGRFRADLLHRLDVVRLNIPALRQRREDVPALAQRFLADAVAKLGTGGKRFDRATLDALIAHDWPGNVRELENLCWRLAALAPGDVVRVADLPEGLRGRSKAPATGSWEESLRQWAEGALRSGQGELYPQALERFEQVMLNAALAVTGGHRQQAAERLGLGRNTLTRKLGSSRRRG